MTDLIIAGASGFGMEVLWLAERLGRTVAGFIDDTPEKQGTVVLGTPVLGPIACWRQQAACEFVVAIGSPRGRRSVVEAMGRDGSPRFATLIDPAATIGKEVVVREGTVICAGTILTVAIAVGRHVIINLNSTVGHGATIEDFCTIAPNVSVSGNVHLQEGVEIGTGAALREKITVGAGAMVGMGSVATKHVEAGTVVVGNPARLLR